MIQLNFSTPQQQGRSAVQAGAGLQAVAQGVGQAAGAVANIAQLQHQKRQRLEFEDMRTAATHRQVELDGLVAQYGQALEAGELTTAQEIRGRINSFVDETSSDHRNLNEFLPEGRPPLSEQALSRFWTETRAQEGRLLHKLDAQFTTAHTGVVLQDKITEAAQLTTNSRLPEGHIHNGTPPSVEGLGELTNHLAEVIQDPQGLGVVLSPALQSAFRQQAAKTVEQHLDSMLLDLNQSVGVDREAVLNGALTTLSEQEWLTSPEVMSQYNQMRSKLQRALPSPQGQSAQPLFQRTRQLMNYFSKDPGSMEPGTLQNMENELRTAFQAGQYSTEAQGDTLLTTAAMLSVLQQTIPEKNHAGFARLLAEAGLESGLTNSLTALSAATKEVITFGEAIKQYEKMLALKSSYPEVYEEMVEEFVGRISAGQFRPEDRQLWEDWVDSYSRGPQEETDWGNILSQRETLNVQGTRGDRAAAIAANRMEEELAPTRAAVKEAHTTLQSAWSDLIAAPDKEGFSIRLDTWSNNTKEFLGGAGGHFIGEKERALLEQKRVAVDLIQQAAQAGAPGEQRFKEVLNELSKVNLEPDMLRAVIQSTKRWREFIRENEHDPFRMAHITGNQDIVDWEEHLISNGSQAEIESYLQMINTPSAVLGTTQARRAFEDSFAEGNFNFDQAWQTVSHFRDLNGDRGVNWAMNHADKDGFAAVVLFHALAGGDTAPAVVREKGLRLAYEELFELPQGQTSLLQTGEATVGDTAIDKDMADYSQGFHGMAQAYEELGWTTLGNLFRGLNRVFVEQEHKKDPYNAAAQVTALAEQFGTFFSHSTGPWGSFISGSPKSLSRGSGWSPRTWVGLADRDESTFFIPQGLRQKMDIKMREAGAWERFFSNFYEARASSPAQTRERGAQRMHHGLNNYLANHITQFVESPENRAALSGAGWLSTPANETQLAELQAQYFDEDTARAAAQRALREGGIRWVFVPSGNAGYYVPAVTRNTGTLDASARSYRSLAIIQGIKIPAEEALSFLDDPEVGRASSAPALRLLLRQLPPFEHEPHGYWPPPP